MESIQEQEDIIELYNWLDRFQFSKIKKSVQSDFADGSLIAELIYQVFPFLITVQSFPKTSSLSGWILNWNRLNEKIFHKLDVTITQDQIKNIVEKKQLEIEKFLLKLKRNIENIDYNKLQYENTQRPNCISNSLMNTNQRQNQQIDQEKIELLNKVQLLEKKINKLESILEIKNQKISILEQIVEDNNYIKRK